MKNKLMLLGVNHPRLFVLVGLIMMIGLASGLSQLYKDTSADAFLAEDNPALAYKEQVKEIFSLSDPMVIAIEDNSEQGVYRTETLELIARLSDKIDALETVNSDRTVSLATANNIIGAPDGMEVFPFYELLESEGPEGIRKAIQDFPLYNGLLVSTDGVMSVIIVELYEDNQAEQTYNEILDIVEAIQADEYVNIHVAGEGAVLGFLGQYIDNDARRLNPMAGLIITLMLIFAFRRFMPALLGNVVIAASVLMTLGFMAYSGVPFFVITNAMPVILIGIAVADSIHIFSHYYECQSKDPERSLKSCIEEAVLVMFRPVTLTTLTTMAGFLGLYASAYMPPFEFFGLFTAFGVLIAWFFSIYVLPALIVLLKPAVSKRWIELEKNNGNDGFSRAITWLGLRATARPAVTVTFFAVLALVGAGLTSQLEVNEDRINLFHPEEPIYIADKSINAHLNGTNTIDIVVTTPDTEGLFNLEVLSGIEQLQLYAESLPHVNGSVSVVDYLKQMNKSLNEGSPEFYRLPEDEQLIAQYFLLYSASADPTDFEEEIDYDYRLANIRLQLDTADYLATAPVIKALENYLTEQFNSDEATANLSGRVNVNYHWIKDLGVSHFRSVLISLICVFLVSAALFRSWVAGLLAVTPVVSAILIVYSAMVLLGINIGIGTSMFASVAIGLGIDFAIHTLDRLETLLADGRRNIGEVLNELYPSTGRALLFNYLAIAFGFGVLISSRVVALNNFGTIVVLAVTMSFLAAMLLLPAMVMLFKPAFIFRQDDTGRETEGRSSQPGTLFSLIAVLLVTGLMVAEPSDAGELPTGDDIVARINAVDDGQHQISDMTMILVDKRGKERRRETVTYRKYYGDEKKTVLFYKKPANVKGTGFLTFDYPEYDKDDDQWLYLPALRKVRRISASDRGDYFLGTDFTYEEIKQNGRIESDDYNFRTRRQETLSVDGKAIIALVVEGTPKTPEIARELGYGNTLLWVNPDNWIVVKTEFSDIKGNPLKTFTASDIRPVDGIWTRHQLEVKNHQTGHYSKFLFSNTDYQTEISDKLFTKRSLKKGL